jgi:GT2 family glycosyltransferase
VKPVGIIIITYNRPADMLALLKNLASLDKKEELLEEVIVVNNNSNVDYTAVESYIKSNDSLPINYIFSPENLGVAKGRNYAITFAKAPILVMLDDDAELENSDALEAINHTFTATSALAIASFKVKYFSTLNMQVNAFPHKKFDQRKDLHFFETYYFAGGAHAIKKEAMEAVGGYPTDFFYGMEEYDLSYKLIAKGYKIVYTDKIVMLHKESPEGRSPHKEKMKMLWINKSKVAWKYLPTPYFISTAIMWSFEYLSKSKFDLPGFIKGWQTIFTSIPKEQRTTLSASKIAYLKQLEARLWY